MDLAWEMGRLDWESVLELTPHQFSVWHAFLKDNPKGERRADLRHAHLVAMVANLARAKDAEAVHTRDTLAHFLSELQPKKAKVVGPAQAARISAGRR